MAYSFSDSNGYIGAGPSISGFKEIKALLEEYKDWPRPALEQLIEHGHTNKLQALPIECRNLANKTNDKDIKHSLSEIAKLASKAEEVLILEH